MDLGIDGYLRNRILRDTPVRHVDSTLTNEPADLT